MKSSRNFIPFAVCSLALVACLWPVCRGVTDQSKKQSAGAVPATGNLVEIRDFQFKPAVLMVKAGVQVSFVNRDEEPHTVASADGKFVKSKPLDTDQTFTVTLSTPGEYTYFCTVHPHMTGKITVSAP